MKKTAITHFAFMALSLLGTCEPAPLLAQATTSPAKQAAILQHFLINPVSSAAPARPVANAATAPASTQPLYLAPPAPATVHVSLLNLLTQPTDWLAELDTWDFGDPNGLYAINPCPVTAKSSTTQAIGNPNDSAAALVNLNTALQGPIAAYQYEKPGTYTITLTRTFAGRPAQVITQQVIVPASTRTVYYIGPDGNDVNPGTDVNHPLRTATAAAKLAGDRTEFRFRRGSVYTLEPEFSMKHHDMLIDCYGDPGLPLPVIQRIPANNIPAQDCPTFTSWPGQTFNVTIRHLRIDSPWTPALSDSYPYHEPSAIFGTIRGSNYTVSDCEFANLLEGPHGDPAVTGLLLLRNRQVEPLGIPSRTLWLEGRDVVAIGNVASNSTNESPLRAASTGIIGGLIAFNDIAQQLDPAHHRATVKAAVTLRTLCDVAVISNRITSGEFSFDPHTATVLDQRVLVQGNQVFNAQIDLQTNIRHAVFRDNFVQRDQGPCITINPWGGDPAQWIEDLQMIDNTGQGWMPNGRLLQINGCTPDQFRGFICDPSNNLYTRITATQAIPFPH